MTLHKHDTKSYSNREIDSKHGEILTVLNRIEVQTRETIGRLGKLEQWRAYLMGSITILSLIVLPLSFWVLTQTAENSEILTILEK